MKYLLLPICFIINCGSLVAQYAYPKAPKTNDKVEKFGYSIADPYRELEDLDAKPTKDWLVQQGDLLRKYRNSHFADYTVVERDLSFAYSKNYATTKIRDKIGGYYFSTKYAAVTDHSPSIQFKAKLSYGWDRLMGTGQFLRDDNDVIDVGLIDVSANDSLAGIGISHSGSDWLELHIINLQTKELIDEKIEWVKGGFHWGKNGFFMNSMISPKGITKFRLMSKIQQSIIIKSELKPNRIFNLRLKTKTEEIFR